jgi:hypothetical protein
MSLSIPTFIAALGSATGICRNHHLANTLVVAALSDASGDEKLICRELFKTRSGNIPYAASTHHDNAVHCLLPPVHHKMEKFPMCLAKAGSITQRKLSFLTRFSENRIGGIFGAAGFECQLLPFYYIPTSDSKRGCGSSDRA